MNVSRASQLQSELKRRARGEKEEKPWGRGTEFNEYKQGQTA